MESTKNASAICWVLLIAFRFTSVILPTKALTELAMNPQDYEYLPSGKVQCPKCGNLGEILQRSNTGYALEYAGVCETRLETGGTCSTTFNLRVTAHLFPVQET